VIGLRVRSASAGWGYGSAMAKRMTKKERWQKTTEIWWFTGYHQIREAIENIIDVVDDEDMDDDLDQRFAQLRQDIDKFEALARSHAVARTQPKD
jgi:hypothetical protein